MSAQAAKVAQIQTPRVAEVARECMERANNDLTAAMSDLLDHAGAGNREGRALTLELLEIESTIPAVARHLGRFRAELSGVLSSRKGVCR